MIILTDKQKKVLRHHVNNPPPYILRWDAMPTRCECYLIKMGLLSLDMKTGWISATPYGIEKSKEIVG